jgi:beta-lactamase class A
MHFSKKRICLILMHLLIFGGLYYLSMLHCDFADKTNQFHLLSEKIAWMDLDTFLQTRESFTITYRDLKQELLKEFEYDQLGERYSYYFEDLTTGSWLGINEKEQFIPASLLKLPTMVAVLKKVELGHLALEDKISLTEDLIDDSSGTLGRRGVGASIDVRTLLDYLIRESDNTALLSLNSLLTEQEYVNARLALGIPAPTDSLTLLSTKEYTNIFRSLYLSTYLRRTFSQLALSMLSETDYHSQLPAGVPDDVQVAHKVGFYKDGGYYHDCGIIYAPKKPYLLCIMSHDSSLAEANAVIKKLSSVTYEYVISH